MQRIGRRILKAKLLIKLRRPFIFGMDQQCAERQPNIVGGATPDGNCLPHRFNHQEAAEPLSLKRAVD